MASDSDDMDSFKEKFKTKEIYVRDNEDSERSSTASEEEFSDEAEEVIEKRFYDQTPEYWQMQKLIKYMKAGNQAMTWTMLSCMKDFDLESSDVQFSIQDNGGLEVLVNVLETQEIKCKIGACEVLVEISQNEILQKSIIDLGAIPVLVSNLMINAADLQTLICETLYYLGKHKKGQKEIRHSNGIALLVDLLDVNEEHLQTPKDKLRPEVVATILSARSGVRALWSVSKSPKNKEIMIKAGVVHLLAKMLRSVHFDLIPATIGTLSECIVMPSIQLAVRTEGMIHDIIKYLSTKDNPEFLKLCCQTILNCSEDAKNRELIREEGGLIPLLQILEDPKTRENRNLFASVTGAIWKTAQSLESVEIYVKRNTVNILTSLLDPDEDDCVLANAVGALAEFFKLPSIREVFRRLNGIQNMITLLNYRDSQLLINLGNALSLLALEPDSLAIIEKLDGLRLIWSLLKIEKPEIQASAAWALVPCIKFGSDTGEEVRTLVGGIQIVINLLDSEDEMVLAGICAMVAEIAKDPENLLVLMDMDTITKLAANVNTESDLIKEQLALAIAYCCVSDLNCKLVGRLGSVTPLVGYMTSENPKVQKSAAIALFHLSSNLFNCITMHESGVVQFLLHLVCSEDQELQVAAAGCLKNIRKCVLGAEKDHLIRDERLNGDNESVENDPLTI